MMPIGVELKNMKKACQIELSNGNKETKQEHNTKSKNGMTMEEEMKEGESLCDGFEKWNMPLEVWLASKISDVSRHLRALN